MKNRTLVKAKYSKGDKVVAKELHEGLLTVADTPKWNGQTYMYAFEETEMRLGQIYLQKP